MILKLAGLHLLPYGLGNASLTRTLVSKMSRYCLSSSSHFYLQAVRQGLQARQMSSPHPVNSRRGFSTTGVFYHGTPISTREKYLHIVIIFTRFKMLTVYIYIYIYTGVMQI
jgi:hypothetical protein